MKNWVGTTGFNTASAAVNLTLADHGMTLGDYANTYLRMHEFTPQSSVWLHYQAYFANLNPNNNNPFIVGRSGGENVFDVVWRNGSNQKSIRLYNSGSPVEVATAAGEFDFNPRVSIDIFVDMAVSGTIDVYIDGTSVLTYSGDTTQYGFSNIDQFEWRSPGAGNDVFLVSSYTVSQVIVADEDTRNLVLHSLRVTAAGSINEWPTGNYLDVDENNSLDNGTTYMQTSDPNDRVTFGMENISGSFSTYTVEALEMWAITHGINPAAPNYRCISRHPNTNVHQIGVQKAFSTFWISGGQHCIAELNPDTSAAWTQSEINDLEMGIESLS